MKHLNHLVKLALFGILAAVLFSGCGSNSGGGEVSAGAVEIPADKNTITFAVTSGQYSDVAFTHKTHSSQYMNDDCITCHAHSGVRDNTIWNCDACHTPDASGPDDQNCSDPNEPGHACWMVQCENCHATLTPNPAPDCADCHSTLNGGAFIDSAVEGLFFFTSTRRGFTDTNGAFSYQPGETAITFSLGSVTIGTGVPKSIMSPFDLVLGADDTTCYANNFSTLECQTVSNIARFLQTLDADGIHSNGILIPLQVLNHIQGRSIIFDVTSNAFETNPNIPLLLSDLENAGIFTANTPRSLLDANTAETNLKTALDSLASGCRISAIQSSPLAVTGLYEPDVGQSFTYQWHRADDSAGTNEAAIFGETSATYQPVPGDDGKYLVLDVVFDGASHRCKPVVPNSATNSVTVYATINSSQDVDKYTLQLSASADLIIDVESHEAPGHIPKGPTDFFGNGDANDFLVTNIYFFESGGTLIEFRDGAKPGTDAPGAFSTRSGKNPYLGPVNSANMIGLAAGDYIFAIGAYVLSQADAVTGVNSDGSNFDPTSRTNYRMSFTFTP